MIPAQQPTDEFDDGRDVVFSNDQEIAQFLHEKIEKY